MANVKFKILAGLLALALSPQAFADSGLFVEPALTYEAGSTKATYPSPLSDSTGHTNGVGIGARVGFHIAEVIFAGIDARYSKPHFTDSSLNYGATATETNWGPVVGLQTPLIGLRVWAGYILGGDLDPDASGNVDVKYSSATGYRMGAGFRVMMVSLNLEYQQLKYGTTTLQQAGPLSGNLSNVKLNDDSWIASVSFPIEL